MQTGEFKPLIAAVLLPPTGPLLLAMFGFLLVALRQRISGVLIALSSLSLLWLLSCNTVAVELARTLLPPVQPLAAGQLQVRDVQAVVVLGGGVLAKAPEYGQAQPSANTLARLRYGVWLTRQAGAPVRAVPSRLRSAPAPVSPPAGLPLAFAGGIGWAATNTGSVSEGEVARRAAKDDYGVELRWVEDNSRDTAENAQQMRVLLKRDGIERIALVTDAWHMPRAVLEFQRAGFDVTAAPTGFAMARERNWLEWMPSAHGLTLSRQVLREWLGLRAAR